MTQTTKKQRKYIVKMTAMLGNRPSAFTRALLADSARHASIMARGELYRQMKVESVKVLSADLDPHTL